MGTDAKPAGVGSRRRDTSGCAPSSSRTNRGIAKKTPATPLRSEQCWSDYAKSWHVPFALDSVVKPAFYSADSTSESSSVPSTPVSSGMARSKMSGVVLRSDWKELTDERVKVCECMMRSPESDQTSYVFKQVAGYLATKKLSFVLLVRNDECGPHSYMAMVSAPPKRPYLIIYLFFIILHTLISKFNFSSFKSLKLNFSKFYS